jgi:hypothetical protein
VLILREVATDEPVAARRGLPIDDVLRIAGSVLAQLQDLAASAEQRPCACAACCPASPLSIVA